jgi:hypothetical protein
MLKVIKYNLTLIIPEHWMDGRGFLKVPAVYATKLFFGDITLEQALEGAKKKWRYGWQMKEVINKEEVNKDENET